MKTCDQFNAKKIYIPFSLMKSKTLTSTAKLLYALIMDYSFDNNQFLTYENLLSSLGLTSSDQLDKAFKELIKEKIIDENEYQKIKDKK